MAERATRERWKTEPMSEERVRLGLTFALDKPQMDVVSMGVIPEEMEDKWFIFFEGGRLYFHRSWTGFAVYEIAFKGEGRRHVAEVWASRDPARWQGSNVTEEEKCQQDIRLVKDLMRWRFGVQIGDATG